MNTNKNYHYMRIVYNNWLPLPGYSAMMWWGKIYARKRYKPLSATSIQHEEIHRLQAKECGSYWSYYWQYLKYWFKYGYKNIPFEREAYAKSHIRGYLNNRPAKAHLAYL